MPLEGLNGPSDTKIGTFSASLYYDNFFTKQKTDLLPIVLVLVIIKKLYFLLEFFTTVGTTEGRHKTKNPLL